MSNGAQTRYLSTVLNFNRKVTDDYLSNSVNEMKGGNNYQKKKKDKRKASMYTCHLRCCSMKGNRKRQIGYENPNLS